MAGRGEEEFDEGEVWDVLQDHHQSSKEAAPLPDFYTPPRSSRSRSGKNKGVKDGDEELGTRGAARGKGKKPSSSTAPVAIPGWSSSRRTGCPGPDRGEEEEEEEEGGEMLPPHEWLAKKMERMSAAAASPEMARGRSKGREMRKFRDAVLPKTAFSEQ
ncbi:uncharacterized protein LOC100839045 [Brachypodium distachyon]|uniref:Uncharacterized protein n=1 Tax=Brachypodium distachyon TaxID=15368 RepID=A0A0Q3JVB1_BRADI|nr:uncharacterized protein LOC100839045 [Brachypodium distachyon]KQK16036.1 hypothetical protein BRADI_1g26393v3 [Brachypodium distachyon]|eukprot:XP_003560159.1 uncharacterized protein LOC100839045 [Brachypodium distachyon]